MYDKFGTNHVDIEESRRIRALAHWNCVMTFYVLDVEMAFTKDIIVESAGKMDTVYHVAYVNNLF